MKARILAAGVVAGVGASSHATAQQYAVTPPEWADTYAQVAVLAAGVGTVVAAYGYTASIEDVRNWHADLVIDRPQDLLAWILPPQRG